MSSAANAKEVKRLQSAYFHIVVVTQLNGVMSIEAIESTKVRARQKLLAKEYATKRKAWETSYISFRRDPENKGVKFWVTPPGRPSIIVKASRIRGKTNADAAVKLVDEKWLKPRLAKIAARAKAKADKAAKKNPRNDPESLPEGNRIKNGGFEDRKSKTGLADGWSSCQLGKKGKKYSVRMNKTNPREGGAHCVVLRSMDEGAKPGVGISVKLVPASYEIRYWACADVGKSAMIQVTFGGKDLPAHDVSDEWEQFKDTVTVEKRNFKTKLLISTSTCRVRVYVDDVEVEAVNPEAE
jgi:hypothetical protein